jgi:hypothetical protein
MAYFTWSLLFAAGQKQNPLDISGNAWKYQYAPYDAICEVLNRGTTATVTAQITSGSDEVQQVSPVQAGGTIGVTPSRLNTEPVTFRVSKGDLIQINLTATSGTPTVDGSIEMTPVGGMK